MAGPRPQRRGNLLRDNYRSTLVEQTSNLGDINKKMGIEGVDDLTPIKSNGDYDLSYASPDESDGVPFAGSLMKPHTDPPPSARTGGGRGISHDPNAGKPGAV
jgi:hypothetical protein